MPWRPTTILRRVEGLITSTAPILVETDAGRGMLKTLGNTQGPGALTKELIGTRLAAWFGLPTFDLAVIDVPPELTADEGLPLGRDGEFAEPGPAIITRFEDGDSWTGTAEELSQVGNAEELSALVVFDTWVRNLDRYWPRGEDDVHAHYDNLFLSAEDAASGRYLFRAFDHTHCLGGGLTERVVDRAGDATVYGAFPEFEPYLAEARLSAARTRLRRFKPEVFDPIAAEIPDEWGLSAAVVAALLDFLLRRAAYLVNDPPIGLTRGPRDPQLRLPLD